MGDIFTLQNLIAITNKSPGLASGNVIVSFSANLVQVH